MKTLKVLTIVAITGLAATMAANACPSNGTNQAQCETNKQDKCKKNNYKHNRHSKSDMREIFQQLDLTPEQKTSMREQRKGMRKQMQAKRETMRGERGMSGMAKFISANGFDKQGFMDMAAKRSQNMAEMRADMIEKKMNILTDEQRVKLVSLLQEKQK